MGKGISYRKFMNNKVRYQKVLRKHNIDTIILDNYKYVADIERYCIGLGNIKNLVIDNNSIKRLVTNSYLYESSIVIQNTNAENIYFNDQDNLGGLTFPEFMYDYNLYIKWTSNKINCNLKQINLIFNNRLEKIDLNDNINYIKIFPEKDFEAIKNIVVYVNDNKYGIRYEYDYSVGLKNKEYTKYTYSNNDVKDRTLDLLKIKDSKEIYFNNVVADTLIINKENLFDSKIKDNITSQLTIKKLRIIDDNKMKLNPETEILFDGVFDTFNYFITNDKRNIFLYLDQNNELKIIDKVKLLENKDIEDVEFIKNSDCELLLIKYKNGNFKIIDEYNECLIDELFGDFLTLNLNSYDFYAKEIPCLKKYILNKEWDKPFKDTIIDNNLLFGMYEDYLKFIERIKLLKEKGFKDETIKYLIRRKYENIVNTKSINILDINEISEHDVKLFNYMSDKHEKVLYKEKKK